MDLADGRTTRLDIGLDLVLSRLALLEARVASLLSYRDGEWRGEHGPLPTLTIDADAHAAVASGFHAVERDGAGRPFRWAGKSDTFEFRFHVDRRAARSFRLIGFLAPGVASTALGAFVDYRAVLLTTDTLDGLTVASGSVPADPMSDAATLTFRCPPVTAANGDARRLSFAFSRLEIGG